MKRITLEPRADWRQRVESVGMDYHSIDGECYWDESACYRFSRSQIDILDDVTTELHGLCLNAVEQIIHRKDFDRLHIPEWMTAKIVASWEAQEPSIVGRFDLSWDGSGYPKMLEYNADTPTSLLEAGMVQWFWLRDQFPDADQFNSIHEKLLDFWTSQDLQQPVHFVCASASIEDLGNVEYLRDTAIQAGLTTQRLFVEEIGWHQPSRRFVDLENQPIQTLFKLYPWEWMVQDEFGRYLLETEMRVIEPAWKMLLSNKGILPILWELFPGHPNLLEAHFDAYPLSGDHVRKPLFSREGGNIEIHRAGNVVSTPGSYGSEGYIHQRYAGLPDFDGNYPVIGSWIIAGQAAGIGIREDKSEITSNGSRFIPHYFIED
jgi:glutathionylspermidine synthase